MSTPGESRSCGSVSQDGNTRHRVAENALQFSGQVVGFAPGRGDHQQGTLPRQRTGDEQPRAGRADQAQFGGSTAVRSMSWLEGRRCQRQLDEPRDRGIWAGRPRCGHDAPILGAAEKAPKYVNIAPGAVKGS